MTKKGFTLIELLVVITIIAILTTIGLTVYTSAQKSSRVAKRIQDIKAIQTALELYYSANKSYPTTSSVWWSECDFAVARKAASAVIVGLTPTYMPEFPSDPTMKLVASDTAAFLEDSSCYVYKSDGVDYKLLDYKIGDFTTNTEYQTRPELIDLARDNITNCSESGTPPALITAWAIYSSSTSKCW